MGRVTLHTPDSLMLHFWDEVKECEDTRTLSAVLSVGDDVNSFTALLGRVTLNGGELPADDVLLHWVLPDGTDTSVRLDEYLEYGAPEDEAGAPGTFDRVTVPAR